MKRARILNLCLILAALTYSCWAEQNYQLYVNGVLYRAPSVLEKGLPYFPVDVLAEATGTRIVSFSESSVRLGGSPVDFVPTIRQGRPFLPAEAFAMASGGQVEIDQTRGLVLYYRGNTGHAGGSSAGSSSTPTTGPGVNAIPGAGAAGTGAADRANIGVTINDPGPEAPIAAPAAAVSRTPNTEGIHEAVVDAMKTAQEITYAQRWLKHKMYWVNQLDPANSPYLKVALPPAAVPVYAPHPWTVP